MSAVPPSTDGVSESPFGCHPAQIRTCDLDRLLAAGERRRFAPPMQSLSARPLLSAPVAVPLAVEVEPHREVVRVKPAGELDLATASQLREQVQDLLEVGFAQLVIDLRELSFLDVAGLRLLLRLAQDARRDGWQLSLIPGRHQPRMMIALTGTLSQLPFVSLSRNGSDSVLTGVT